MTGLLIMGALNIIANQIINNMFCGVWLNSKVEKQLIVINYYFISIYI